MKFIHTGDWHLGKLVHGIYMTEGQRHILKQFVSLVEEEQPDAVIIAGDLYDRSVPPTEAVELLDEILFRINVKLNTPIVAIAGNHDSAERLSFGSSWYRHSQFYITGKCMAEPSPVVINGVHFHLVPYAEPGFVRHLLDDSSIHSHHDAMKALIGRIEEKMDRHSPHILVGHAFVTGGETCESERTLSVGGSGSVGSELFDAFSYTALGHLHSPDAIRHKKVKYSGSLMKYSFSEAKHQKAVSIIEMDEKGQFEIRRKQLTPKQDMREIEGYLEELLDPQFYSRQNTDDFLKVTLLDEGAILDPMGKLRQIYPHVLHLERKQDGIDEKKLLQFTAGSDSRKSELDMFEQFYQEMTTADFTPEKKELIADVIGRVLKEEGLR